MKQSVPKKRPCIELLDKTIVEIVRRKTPAERMALIFAANRTMRLEGHLCSRYPEWDFPTVMQEIARRTCRRAG